MSLLFYLYIFFFILYEAFCFVNRTFPTIYSRYFLVELILHLNHSLLQKYENKLSKHYGTFSLFLLFFMCTPVFCLYNYIL